MSDLDLNEQSNVRATLNFLRGQMGGFVAVAKALRFDYRTVVRSATGRREVSASMALRVARLLDASVDDLLAGRYRPGACSKCGHMPSYLSQSDFSDESTVVEDSPRPVIGTGLALVK